MLGDVLLILGINFAFAQCLVHANAHGISRTLPQLWMSLMRVLQKEWRNQGIICLIYLDDILIVGTSKTSVARSLDFVCNSPQEWRQRKVKPHTIASCEPFGLRSQFRARSSPCALKQTEKCEERATKLVTKEKVTYKPGLQIPPPPGSGEKEGG